MTDNPSGVIRREMFIAADPATVFAFLTQPDKMTRWMGVRTDLDPRDGGVYLVDVNNQNVARGIFEEAIPNERVVFSFGWEDGAFGMTPGSSRIQIDLEAKDGGTQLSFVHSGLPEVAVAPHTEGWTHYHGRLAIAAEGGDPGPDPKLKEVAA
ncbi:MAG: SRPBCC domain-containing protein [Pseudomonadota bacterium]